MFDEAPRWPKLKSEAKPHAIKTYHFKSCGGALWGCRGNRAWHAYRPALESIGGVHRKRHRVLRQTHAAAPDCHCKNTIELFHD
jgi:hypothetical protein